jgi:hypothetical protein
MADEDETLNLTEACFYCLADTAIDPGAKYICLSYATATQPRSVSHLLCHQIAVKKVRANE